MARLHSKKKGKSGTKRPKRATTPEWVSLSKKEIEDMIVKMAKEGMTQSKIGRVMRDAHGVPSIKSILGQSIGSFLRKEKLSTEYPEDIITLIRKAVKMRHHLKSYKKDLHNKVKLNHVESKIHRREKYYKKKGLLPTDWRYDPETAALLAK